MVTEISTKSRYFESGFEDSERDTEYAPDLKGNKRYAIYDKMRLSDGQVKAALNAIKLPLLTLPWAIEPSSDRPKDRRIAEEVWYDFQNMEVTWQNFVHHLLMSLDYGSIPFEKTFYYDADENRIRVKNLLALRPHSIIKWATDKPGRLIGVRQRINFEGNMEDVDLLAKDLLVVINDQEFSDYRGTSVLRSAYKHWYFVQGLEKIDAIAKERRSAGIDVGIVGENADTKDQNELEEVLEGVRTHQRQYVVIQDGKTDYKVMGLEGTTLSPLESIQHHNFLILRSVLAEFIGMGSGDAGGAGMHKDKTSFFMQSLRSTVKTIEDAMTRQVIAPMTYLNYGANTEPPRLVSGIIETHKIRELAYSVYLLVVAKVITPSPEVEAAMRKLLDLPDMPPDLIRQPYIEESGNAPEETTSTQESVAGSFKRHINEDIKEVMLGS